MRGIRFRCIFCGTEHETVQECNACEASHETANACAAKPAGILKCDYTGTPPFADASWANDPDGMCAWCAGTGHPYGNNSYGFCKCPGVSP